MWRMHDSDWLVMRASQGGWMFPCSVWKFIVVPLFLKNKLRCSPKFTFTEFPCSQKFRSMFPWSPTIFLTVLYNSSQILFFHCLFIFRFYLVSHSTNTPRQNASFSSLMTEKWEKLQYFDNILLSERPFSSYTLKKFFQWSGYQCSLVPDYNSTVLLFPRTYFKIYLVP